MTSLRELERRLADLDAHADPPALSMKEITGFCIVAGLGLVADDDDPRFEVVDERDNGDRVLVFKSKPRLLTTERWNQHRDEYPEWHGR